MGKCQIKKDKRKKNRGFLEYDYESAYNKSLEDMEEWMTQQLFKRTKTNYALKTIKAGEQLEVEIYPIFGKKEDIPEEGRVKKSNREAQGRLNDKNARKRVERLINANFGNEDLWCTFTYDDEHLPADGDIDAALKNVKRFIKRLNYRRKKLGLPNCKYIYVTEYNPDAKIRWHHHVVMDGLLDRDTVEKTWKCGKRSQIRRLEKDENGLSGMANYIVKEKDRIRSEKRWNSSQGLKQPEVKVVKNKRPQAKSGNYRKIERYVNDMVRNENIIKEQMKAWYPEYDFTFAKIYYNDFNTRYYIYTRLRKQKD